MSFGLVEKMWSGSSMKLCNVSRQVRTGSYTRLSNVQGQVRTVPGKRKSFEKGRGGRVEVR
jgi:hypothetical protein